MEEDALPEPLKERVDFGFGLGMTSTAATAAIAGGALTSASTSSSRSVMSFSGSVDVGVEGRHERERELESGGGKVKSVGSGKAEGSMTLEQLEEVMPWELYPAPALALEDGREAGLEVKVQVKVEVKMWTGKRRRVTSGTQASSSTSQGQQTSSHTRQSVAAAAFAEFGLRRRRSTGHGGSGSHAPSGPVAGSGSNTVIGKMRTGKDKDGGKDKSRISTTIQNGLGLGSGISSTMFPPAVGNVPILPMSSSFSAPGITTSASTSSTNTASSSAYTDLGSTSASSTTTADTTNASSEGNGNGNRAPKFSTADRTILEQIKAHLQAREAQFKIKGIGHTVVGGGYSPGKKHHLYDKKEVPYPRSYGKEVVDLDVWETMTALDIAGSLTWHVFSTPPTKVLDIGCGTGTWILQCAGTWKECHFVGLDIVPLHPNLQNVGSSDFASRVTWVQHNFLDVLPFQTEEFDFVYALGQGSLMSYISILPLVLTMKQWDTLFEEIARVMKPGAALELAEEDLFFPGKPIDDDEEEIISVTPDDSSSVTRRNSISSDRHRSSVSAVNGVDKLVEVSERSSHETSVTAVPYTVPPRAGPSRPGSPSRGKSRFEGQSTSIAPPPADDGASVVQQLYPRTHTLSSDPYADFAASHPSLFGSNVAVLGGIAYSASQDPFMEILKQQKQERASSLATKASMPSSPAKTKPSPFLMRSLANKAPTNPRDHMILEAIWNGMLESRFVNLTPLSLLTTYLEYHFKDVRTHPPLRYTFPPVPPKVYDDDSDEDDDNPAPQHPSDSEPDTDDARDAVIPMSKRHRSTKARKSAKRGSSTPTASHGDEQLDERRWLSMQALFQHESPYVSLDESRGFTYSPSRKGFSSNHASKESQSSKLRNVSMLPNQNLNIDIRTLNLHLALRAKEIIACSESMWEWVQEYQAEVANDPSRNSRFRSGSIEGFMVGADPAASGSSLDLTHNAILEMTRDDFDHLLNNFEMDMQDKASVGHALAQRFDWHVFTSPVLQDRKVFDTACKKYDKWLAAQRKAKAPGGPYHQSNNHHSRNSMSAPGLVPSIPESSTSGDSNVISRSISSLPQSTSVDETSSIAATLVPTSNRRDSNDTALPSPSVSHESITSISPQRLSRATRVFVAWKALEKETKQVH
ncbi:hypothetical protein CPB84DRAFT_1785092 [Gymnopilus junonius]|uniref:Methyltransferase domain-containing protein n=1 Tax=Gymnopilus junonius TaxID=109634 RepID=A0A9P5NL07_GYMJU|nr:hypothetical protein CPB84DRAFT_1785092 [Gymnopilus junonius]